MPLLGKLLESLFVALAGFFGRMLVGKVAVRVAAVAALAALGTGLLAAFNAFVAPMVASVFSTQYGQLLGLVFPPVSGTVLAGLMALWVACMAYRLKVRAISITASI
jgi:Family of unknown function (DUF5455)